MYKDFVNVTPESGLASMTLTWLQIQYSDEIGQSHTLFLFGVALQEYQN